MEIYIKFIIYENTRTTGSFINYLDYINNYPRIHLTQHSPFYSYLFSTDTIGLKL